MNVSPKEAGLKPQAGQSLHKNQYCIPLWWLEMNFSELFHSYNKTLAQRVVQEVRRVKWRSLCIY